MIKQIWSIDIAIWAFWRVTTRVARPRGKAIDTFDALCWERSEKVKFPARYSKNKQILVLLKDEYQSSELVANAVVLFLIRVENR